MNAVSSTSWTARRSASTGFPASSSHSTSRITTPSSCQRAGSSTSATSSGFTGRFICHQVRTRVKPAARQPALLPLVVGVRPGVDLLDGEAARRTDLTGLADRPLDQQVRAGPTDLLGEPALDHVQEQHPAGGTVVHAPPRPDQPGVVADDDVLPGPQPVVGDLDQHVLLAGPGPAPPLLLVRAQQLGEPA